MDNTIAGQVGATYGRELRESPRARKPEPTYKPTEAGGAPEGGLNNRVSLSMHDATNRMIIKVTDSKTGRVIREIPPEKYLDMVANFLSTVDMNSGANLDELC